jgi:hypothetical protein
MLSDIGQRTHALLHAHLCKNAKIDGTKVRWSGLGDHSAAGRANTAAKLSVRVDGPQQMAPLLIGLLLINLISVGIILAFVAFETEFLPNRGGHPLRPRSSRARRTLLRLGRAAFPGHGSAALRR